MQDTQSNVAWFFVAVALATRSLTSSPRARGVDSRARGTSVRRAALLHASPVESTDQPPRAITLVWCATAFGDEPTRPLRTLVDESGFGEGPVRRPRGRREGRGSSATRPLLVFGHRGRAHSRLQKTLCAPPSSVPMKSPAAGGGVPSRPPAGRKGSTSQSMLRRARRRVSGRAKVIRPRAASDARPPRDEKDAPLPIIRAEARLSASRRRAASPLAARAPS
jgi:hypothetical protein